jgi:tetratricopeptide (TPR) repeat protein
MNALFAQEWQIVHIAAHGQFDSDEPSRSGVVIGPDMFITANVVRQLPVVPELVFLNCCHLGHVAESPTAPQNPHRLAASVARELMRIGVRAVVAAGWAVDDDPAAEFACRFYDELLEGRLLGDAVHAARRRVREKHRYSMTWCAFQVYGDPAFRLREAPTLEGPARRPHGEKGTLPFVSTQELVRRVQTLEALAGTIGVPSFEELTRAEQTFADELRDYLGNLPDDWETPEVYAAFGAAFSEFGCYREAVDCYRRAWFDGPNKVPLRVLEQLGNVEIRLAQRIAPTNADAAAELVNQAETRLDLALQIGRTGERLALLGSLQKKTATLVSGEARARRIAKACARYREAHEWTLEQTATETDEGRVAQLDPYYVQQWIQMSVLAHDPVDDQAAVLLDAIDRSPGSPSVVIEGNRVVAVARSQDALDDELDYWTRAARANNLLTRGFLIGTPDIETLDSAYRHAFSTRASRRNRDSTIDNLRDLAELHGDTQLGELAASLANRGKE